MKIDSYLEQISYSLLFSLKLAGKFYRKNEHRSPTYTFIMFPEQIKPWVQKIDTLQKMLTATGWSIHSISDPWCAKVAHKQLFWIYC